jgi:hypothetical protein
MWKLEPTEDYLRCSRYYEKKHRRELRAVLVNLATYVAALQVGTNPLQVKFGFIHPEGMGVIAIGEEGRGKSLAATRLYLYPDTSDRVVYQITLGDKNTQKGDIQRSHEFVASLNRGKTGHERDTGDTGQSGGSEEAEEG